MGASWSAKQKSRIIMQSHKAYMVSATQETSFKPVSRYRVPVTLHKIFPGVSETDGVVVGQWEFSYTFFGIAHAKVFLVPAAPSPNLCQGV